MSDSESNTAESIHTVLDLPTFQTNTTDTSSEDGLENLFLVPDDKDDAFTIFIHGVTDSTWNSEKRWNSWIPWMEKLGLVGSQGFRCYQYNIDSDDSPIFSRNGIENEAMNLLEALSIWRKRDFDDVERFPGRRIAFVALDIGGIILKKALSIASLNPRKYNNLHFSVSSLLFVNCPHRSCNTEQLEDIVGELLSVRQRYPSNFLKKVREMAWAVNDANIRFVDTKMFITTDMYNIISRSLKENLPSTSNDVRPKDYGDDDEKKKEPKTDVIAPDNKNSPGIREIINLCFIFDVPFEEACLCEKSHQKLVSGCTEESEDMLSAEYLNQLVTRFQESKDNTIEAQFDLDCLAWIISQAPPVCPPAPVPRDKTIIDCITNLEAFKHLSKHNAPSFLHLHATGGVSKITQHLMEHLSTICVNDSSTYYLLPGSIVYFEFNGKDPIPKQMASMIAYFVSVAFSRFDRPSVIAPLTRYNHQRCWTLDDLFLIFTHVKSANNMKDLTFAVGRMDLCDEPTLQLFLRYMKLLADRQRERVFFIISTQGDEEALSKYPTDWARVNLENVAPELYTKTIEEEMSLNSDLQPLSPWGANALLHISHAARYLSPTELACLMNTEDDEIKLTLDEDVISKFIKKINEHIDSRVVLQSNKLHPIYPFDGDEDLSFHCSITKRLLLYLKSPVIQDRILSFCDRHPGLMGIPVSPPGDDLISYAVLHWPSHYLAAGKMGPLEPVCDFLQDQKATRVWSEAYRVLSNPATRTNRCYLSPIPLVGMIGLEDAFSALAKKLQTSKTFQIDCNLALIEAARYGHVNMAHQIMEKVEPDNHALSDAMMAAGSSSTNDLLHELVDMASRRNGFGWPPDLLLRASTNGDHETVKRLLDSGMTANPPDPFQQRTPLHLAALNGHDKVIELLLEANADIKSKAHVGRTPLLTASTGMASPELIKMLISAGSDIEVEDEDLCPPLQNAIYYGNLAAAEELLKAGADPEHGAHHEDSATWQARPLFLCAQRNQIEGIQLLLKYKAKVDSPWRNLSPLWNAVNNENLEASRLLLEGGADPNLNPDGYDMILLLAVNKWNVELVKLLLDHGADIEQEDNSDSWRNTALSRAAGISNPEVLKCLLEFGANVNHVGKNSQAPLSVATWCANEENVRILVETGADISIPMGPTGWLPIHASYDSPANLRLLLGKGSDIDVEIIHGTVLHVAVEIVYRESVRFLLGRDPKPNLELKSKEPYVVDFHSDSGFTPLSIACWGDSDDIVRWLIEAGADANHRTDQGRLPIDLTVRNGCLFALRVLLEYRVSLVNEDDEGNTVLHNITRKTTPAMVELLVNGGASVAAQNNKGETPLQKAVNAANSSVAKLLLEKGANPNQSGTEYYSLLHIACSARDLPTLKVLVENGANIQRADTLKEAPRLMTSVLNDWNTDGHDPLTEMLEYLVEECKIDVNGRGGLFESPLTTACYYELSPQVRYLLEKGTDPNVEDTFGRRAFHLSCTDSGTDIIETLLDFKAEIFADGQPVRDKMGRTAIHFAAVSGNWMGFKRISDLYDETELLRPDNEGWTPLFWALLNRRASVEIVRYLIDHGADLWMTVSGLKLVKWSPLRLGRYIGVSDEILSLLTPDPLMRHIENGMKKENWDDGAHISRKADEKTKCCLSCRVPNICGIYYVCATCKDYDLCFRCYMSQNSFHKSHGEDTWLEKGPEFPDLEESLEQDTNHPGSLSGDDNLRNESPDDESILSREEGEEDESIISSDSSSTVSDDQPSDDDVDDESVA